LGESKASPTTAEHSQAAAEPFPVVNFIAISIGFEDIHKLGQVAWGCVKNTFPVFVGNHPAERDGNFQIEEVIFDASLGPLIAPTFKR
jgi:hypothetical protein